MRRFAVDDLAEPGQRITLSESASHHLSRVLRVAEGTELVAFDGRGRQAPARFVGLEADRAVLEIVGPSAEVAPSGEVHVLLGQPKKDAMGRAVRMGTELGMTHLHVVRCSRSIPKGDGNLERWRRIAGSAAQQCGRADMPGIFAPSSLAECIERLPHPIDARVCVPGGPDLGPAAGAVAVLIGPEGGLTEQELARAEAQGFRRTGIGDWVLRTDTAVAAALSKLR